MLFAEAQAQFLEYHLQMRTGERRRKLKDGHGHGQQLFLENIWWPAFGNFNHLHPEYEVRDIRKGYRYLDFAFIMLPIKICIEIDGFGTHSRDIDREKFADDRNRQNQLTLDDWRIIRFAYDDVKDNPQMCQQVLIQLISQLLGHYQTDHGLSYHECEVIRIAMRNGHEVTIKIVMDSMKIGDNFARKLLKNLMDKEIIHPVLGHVRIHKYRLQTDKLHKRIF